MAGQRMTWAASVALYRAPAPTKGDQDMRREPLAHLPLIALAVVGAFVASSCCHPGLIGSVPVTLHPQETWQWCWAASGQMVMHYLGNNVAQCTQANNRFSRTDCCDIELCDDPYQAHPCVMGGWPEFDKYGFSFDRTSDAALSWDDLKKQVSPEPYCRKTPFAFTWHWDGGGGHVMVANGYVEVGGTRYVSVLNPWAPCVGEAEIITYEYYVSSPGHHTHWDDFYNVK